MFYYEDVTPKFVPQTMLDPVEHSVVEASWGEAFLREDRQEILKRLGAIPLNTLVQKGSQ